MIFEQEGQGITPQLMAEMVYACEVEAAKQNLGLANPDYDETKPISEINQPVVPVKGPTAVGAFIKWFLGEIVVAHTGKIDLAKQQRGKVTAARAEISKVKIVDKKKVLAVPAK